MRAPARISAIAFTCVVSGAAVGAAHAQGPLLRVERDPSFELRGDVLAARETTLHAGAAVLWPVGRAVSIGIQAGAGVTDVEAPAGDDDLDDNLDDDLVASGRAELVARFELDPYEERRWGLYGSAGGGVLAVRGRTGRGLLHASVGVERRTGSGYLPALELGLGGGVRVGIVVRRR
ncbi:MAG TPA: hypothetical protein VGE02_17210 [Gemmatimonadales bacterium]